MNEMQSQPQEMRRLGEDILKAHACKQETMGDDSATTMGKAFAR